MSNDEQGSTIKVEMDMPEPPEGWEYTGEYRKATPGEPFLGERGLVYTGITYYEEFILRRKLQVGDYVEHATARVNGKAVGVGIVGYIEKDEGIGILRKPDDCGMNMTLSHYRYLDPAEGKKRWGEEIAKLKPTEINKFIESLERAIKQYKRTGE